MKKPGSLRDRIGSDTPRALKRGRRESLCAIWWRYPFSALRVVDSDTFTFLRECYMYGILNGEALQADKKQFFFWKKLIVLSEIKTLFGLQYRFVCISTLVL